MDWVGFPLESRSLLLIHHVGSHSLDQALLLFGRPKSITAFLKSTRGVDSEIDDSFTVVLQYDGKQKDLLVTVKTTINAPDSKQLKCWFRGEKGAFTAVSNLSTTLHALYSQ